MDEETLDTGVYDETGGSPLSIACGSSHFEVAKWLVENGAPVDGRGYDGDTPLVEAVVERDLQTAQHLIENRLTEVTEYEYLGTRILKCATRKKDMDILQYFLSLGIFSCLQLSDCLGSLTLARNTDVMKLLVSSGASLHELDENLATPFQYAVRDDSIEVIEVLLSLGTDVNRPTDETGYLAIHFMAQCGRVEKLRFVQRVCGYSADFSAPSEEEEYAPLHVAASEDQTEVIRFLLGAIPPEDVDIDIETKYGYTPLFLATQKA